MKRVYKLLMGVSGRRWLVADQENSADNIYVEGGKDSQGFGGATLTFHLDDGTELGLKGPWHSNSGALFLDTGHDVRDKHLTKGVIALYREYDQWGKAAFYSGVFHHDEEPVIGRYHRIKELAPTISDGIQQPVFYAMVSPGGGSSCLIQPTEEPTDE